MSAGYTIVDTDTVGIDYFPESGVAHSQLTEPLGATEMRVNKVVLGPGEGVAYHTHEAQEELYYALEGPGEVFVEGELETVPEGGFIRIAPSVPRQVLNTSSDQTHTWLMFGAPTVGTVEDFGAYTVSEGGYELD